MTSWSLSTSVRDERDRSLSPLFPGCRPQVRRRAGAAAPTAASTPSRGRSPRQYRRDTTSPVMVSGVLQARRVRHSVPVGRRALRHLCRLPRHLAWQYPAIIVIGSLLTVIFLEFTDCYQISALLRPLQNSGRLLLSWSGTFAVLALTGFFMKVSSRFLAHVVRQLVRHRLRAAVRAAAGDVAADPALGAQRQDGAARRHRRRRQGRRAADPLGRAAVRQRHPHLRHLRRPRRHAARRRWWPAIPSSATSPS